MFLINRKKRLLKIAFLFVLSPVPIFPQNLVIHPSGFKQKKAERIFLKNKAATINVYARRFAQGEAAYLEIRPAFGVSTENFSAEFEGKPVLLTKTEYGLNGLFAIPVETKPGKKILSFYSKEKGTFHMNIAVANTYFPVKHIPIRLGSFSEENKAKQEEIKKEIERNRETKKKVFSTMSVNMLDGELSHPRDMHKITSEFYAKRYLDYYRIENKKKVKLKPVLNLHSGTDLKGKTGEPIFALASGRILCAEKMYYEGIFTVIDHGNGIFTGYMHQSQTSVKPGDYVKAGQKIGASGATGAVTGAHLHLSLWIRGEIADPLSMLSLPIQFQNPGKKK